LVAARGVYGGKVQIVDEVAPSSADGPELEERHHGGRRERESRREAVEGSGDLVLVIGISHREEKKGKEER